MTILVAVKKNNRVFLGVDSFASNGNTVMPDLTYPWKIIKLKHAYIATTGWSLLQNIVEHLKATNHKMMENTFSSRNDVFSFFLVLYSELRKNYTLVDPGKETYAQIYNNFLIATASNIYAISSNISVTEHEHYVAKGAGADYALGCLYGTYDIIDDGKVVVRRALEAACKLNIYCREPLEIIEITKLGSDGQVKGSTRKARAHAAHATKSKAQTQNKTSIRRKRTGNTNK